MKQGSGGSAKQLSFTVLKKALQNYVIISILRAGNAGESYCLKDVRMEARTTPWLRGICHEGLKGVDGLS